MSAFSCELLTKAVGRGAPFHRTLAPGTNPVPRTVSVNPGPPGATLAGIGGWLISGMGFCAAKTWGSMNSATRRQRLVACRLVRAGDAALADRFEVSVVRTVEAADSPPARVLRFLHIVRETFPGEERFVNYIPVRKLGSSPLRRGDRTGGELCRFPASMQFTSRFGSSPAPCSAGSWCRRSRSP